jgi:hypothetical protein
MDDNALDFLNAANIEITQLDYDAQSNAFMNIQPGLFSA